jgi:hypothetical protein
MYELGTNHTRLWRSSKNEWFGGTPGFYWGDNNAKDLTVNLEYQPDPQGAPEYMSVRAYGVRDLAWQDLYRKYKGQIDEQFGSWLSVRAAGRGEHHGRQGCDRGHGEGMMVWAEIGRPNESVWQAPRTNPGPNHGLYPGGYHLFSALASESLLHGAGERRSAVGRRRLRRRSQPNQRRITRTVYGRAGCCRHPTPIPGSWRDRRLLQIAPIQGPRTGGRSAANSIPRIETGGRQPQTRFQREQIKGVLFLDGLRRKMGDDAFFKLMEDYFAANTTKTVTAQSFLDKAGASFDFTEPGDGPAYLPGDIGRRLASPSLFTARWAKPERIAMPPSTCRRRYRDHGQMNVAVRKDFEVSDEELKTSRRYFRRPAGDQFGAGGVGGEARLHYNGGVFR